MGLGWFGAPEHHRWLAQETHALLGYARAAAVPAGFGWIGPDGAVDASHPVELWITGRMTFCFSLGALMGIPGCRRYADHGVRTLSKVLRDHEHGGWYSAVEHELDSEGHGVPVDPRGRKECYQHAFVLLAAATATAADRPGAHELLREAMALQERHWWDERHGLPIESYAVDFTDPEDYRGINAAMHTVEAYLVTADVTGDVRWLERAVQIIDFAVNVQARGNDWRLPEHYDTAWRPQLEYNRDQPAHPFRPYGVTPGHGLEWARLTVQARGALVARALPVPEWMLDAAESLFDRARSDGWRVDGEPGFVYTTDFSGKPVVHERMHWVVCEGVSAAAALRRALLDDGRGEIDVELYEHCYRSWLDFAEEYLIEAPGVWTHELDAGNAPSTRTWAGHPDIYHALQMTLMPRLPVWPAMGQALAEGRLDDPASALPVHAQQPRRRGFFGRK
ncbi:AGE family epimerase/isomerase [Actinomyces bowdenii]|uniref:AGE family epimerase/isomerase n=1 Tax=Actinomyces bowdenii TaxID=131109 RepID=UPI001ABCD3BD|nr:AGE family epimerase/isomerase [Actinomyces bowdenii]MBO3725658.1 AGE family epimerase/isomerase [Actinomyces bowdenii]